jgi:uncharacterized cupin superfamily protein
MSNQERPAAVEAAAVAPKATKSIYPEVFHGRVSKREKRALGDFFGLTVFGVNLTRILPGGVSALRHAHSKNDEFVYIVQGEAMLVTNAGETKLTPGMCAGFKAGTGDAHHLVNRTDKDVLYLEVGDRLGGDEVDYPDDDIVAVKGTDGKRRFFRKDGTPY